MQRRSFARTPYERHGQVNLRVNDHPHAELLSKTQLQLNDDQPSCIIFVSKRKGFGTTGNHESRPMTIHGIRHLKRSFDPDQHHRYLVNVYLKKTGASDKRRKTRGW